MVATAWRDEAVWRRPTRRWRRRWELTAQGTHPNTPLAQLVLRLKTECTRAREYNKVASESSVGGQSIAGPAAGEDGHGSTSHSAGHQKEEGGDKKHRRAISEQEPDDVETEERAPPLLLLMSCAM